jgi:AraC-like DNA-binding protein
LRQDYAAASEASLAGLPNGLTASPGFAGGGDDALSAVLRTIRLSGALQFCFMPRGQWQTDAAPSLARLAGSSSRVVPFHIVVEGACWLKIAGERLELAAGDVVAFPFGAPHQLGFGHGGPTVTPVKDLPPKPWRAIPVMRYGQAGDGARLLCGFLQFGSVAFRPLQDALPAVLHVRTAADPDAAWLAATLRRIVFEAERGLPGGLSVIERLTEITFIELLRHSIAGLPAGSVGWLAAMADPSLGRCLSAIHADPHRDWSLPTLASAAGLSRSTVAERFATVLQTSPVRYVREWRLCLAGEALQTTGRPIADIAFEAGYGSEAAFSRAFARTFATPPAAWRHTARP